METVVLIGLVFAKIAWNFSPVLVLGIIAFAVIEALE
jgi:hypothetical protein